MSCITRTTLSVPQVVSMLSSSSQGTSSFSFEDPNHNSATEDDINVMINTNNHEDVAAAMRLRHPHTYGHPELEEYVKMIGAHSSTLAAAYAKASSSIAQDCEESFFVDHVSMYSDDSEDFYGEPTVEDIDASGLANESVVSEGSADFYGEPTEDSITVEPVFEQFSYEPSFHISTYLSTYSFDLAPPMPQHSRRAVFLKKCSTYRKFFIPKKSFKKSFNFASFNFKNSGKSVLTLASKIQKSRKSVVTRASKKSGKSAVTRAKAAKVKNNKKVNNRVFSRSTDTTLDFLRDD